MSREACFLLNNRNQLSYKIEIAEDKAEINNKNKAALPKNCTNGKFSNALGNEINSKEGPEKHFLIHK